MTDRDLMQQALVALVAAGLSGTKTKQARDKAIAALRERLAQPECCCQEPDAPGVVHRTDGPCYMQEQPVQEPVAFINVVHRTLEWAMPTVWRTPTVVRLERIPLYTTPQPREWQGLTPARLVCLWRESNGDESGGVERFARAIEQALREKNGA